MQSYLRITAPFDGMVTERLVHPGARGPAADPVLLVIQNLQLRLVVAVLRYVGGITEGASWRFRSPPILSGRIREPSHGFPCSRQGDSDHGG
jgi:hypothetical protein